MTSPVSIHFVDRGGYVDGSFHLSDWLSPQSLSSHSEQDGACATYIKGTACTVDFAHVSLAFSLALAVARGSLAACLCSRCGRCVRFFSLLARQHLIGLVLSVTFSATATLVSRRSRLFSSRLSPFSPSAVAAAAHGTAHGRQPLLVPLFSPRLLCLFPRLGLVSRLPLLSSLASPSRSPRLSSRLVPTTTIIGVAASRA